MPDHEDRALRTAPTLPEGSVRCTLFAPWLALDDHARKQDHQSELLQAFTKINSSTFTRKQKSPNPEGLEQLIRIPLKDHYSIA
ncbi:MAG: hypothetical protein JJ920_09970 [Roseitalea sp.]|jgi:hypothetical protein|nr:hypothetical protein [Roseitalea sp.]MBO6720923.1 hypothetical protein [Roseitalea sp.]MBO6743228.1 hypothetical protein [Roseitalea sp.]